MVRKRTLLLAILANIVIWSSVAIAFTVEAAPGSFISNFVANLTTQKTGPTIATGNTAAPDSLSQAALQATPTASDPASTLAQAQPAVGDVAQADPSVTASPSPTVPPLPSNLAPADSPDMKPARVQTKLPVHSPVWIAEVVGSANVRVAPSMSAQIAKTFPQGRRVMIYASVQGDASDPGNSTWYEISPFTTQPLYVYSSNVKNWQQLEFKPAAYPGKWIDIDVTKQTMVAYEGSTPVLWTLVSTGLPGLDTNLGTWKIYLRVASQTMTGPGYSLPNVQWDQYFYQSGEAIHGAYWHDNFGHPMSHGCVNATNEDAKWMYDWAELGTPVIVHQ